MTFFRTISEFKTIPEFVDYFEKHAAEIDAMIARGDDVTSEISKLVKATLQNCSRELYFVLLRGVREKWTPFADVDDQRRSIEGSQMMRLMWRDACPGHSAFDLMEMEMANEVDNKCESVTFLLNKEFKSLLENFARSSNRYSSVDSVLRHAVWRYICWMDNTQLGESAPRVRFSYTLRIRQIEKDEYESHFYIALEALRLIFSTWKGEAPDLRCIRLQIQSFDSLYWRKHYLEEFDKLFESFATHVP
ncbi:MAG TPA: hypothetical protein VHV29_13920 [Terriglobales bacterium]|jgi:hypothetical protein|nr:hypothetical protein [Terriglobales bacterium]